MTAATAPTNETAAAPQRDPRLDGLCGLAILPVMLYHLTFFGSAESVVDRAFTFLPSLGWTSVDLFFVLSGYLITGILWRARGADGYYRSFYARRALRIFPLYYAVLVFFLVCAPRSAALGNAEAFWLPGADRETWWYWLYLENLHVAWTARFHHHFLGIVWTLCIEEQFYLVWPLVVAFARSRRRLVQICVGLMAAAFVLRVAAVAVGAPPLTILTFTFCRVDTLALGACIAMLQLDPVMRLHLATWARRVFPAAAVVWLVVIVASQHLSAAQIPDGQVLTLDQRAAQALAFTNNGWMQTLGYEADLFFYASLLVLATTAARGTRLASVLESGVLRGFGRYSYAMYLLHVFVAEIARSVYDPNRTELPFVVEQTIWWVVALALIYGTAWVSWHAFEAPILRLKRFFPVGGPTPAAGPLPVSGRVE